MLKKMKNNIIIVTNDNIIKKAKEVGVTTFLFPFRNYCVGFDNYYSFEDIKEENSYLYINRILTNEDIDRLKELIKVLPSNIKGVFFQDIGIINILKDTSLKSILFSHHLTTNYESINNYLKYIDSVVLSTDITIDEMKDIIDKANKKVCIYKFGMVPIMYSRRTLVTNFKEFYKVDKSIDIIKEPINNKHFKIVENEYGTVIYPYKYYFNNELNDKDLLFNIINPYNLTEEEVNNLFSEKMTMDIFPGFLHTKTIYKLPPKEVK